MKLGMLRPSVHSEDFRYYWEDVATDEKIAPFGPPRAYLAEGEPVPGPTLTVLLDEDSPFTGTIRDAVLLHRRTEGAEDEREQRAIEETLGELHQRLPDLQLHPEPWPGDDPTDHRGIFELLRKKIPVPRARRLQRRSRRPRPAGAGRAARPAPRPQAMSGPRAAHAPARDKCHNQPMRFFNTEGPVRPDDDDRWRGRLAIPRCGIAGALASP